MQGQEFVKSKDIISQFLKDIARRSKKNQFKRFIVTGKKTSHNKSEEKIRKIGLQCNHRQSNKPLISGTARTKSYNYPNSKYLNKGKWTEAAKSLKRKANPTDRDKYGNKR